MTEAVMTGAAGTEAERTVTAKARCHSSRQFRLRPHRVRPYQLWSHCFRLHRLRWALVGTALLTPLDALVAQAAGTLVQPEIRGDVIVAHATAAQVGAGVFWPIGDYLRLGSDLAAGLVMGNRKSGRLGARFDAVGRLHPGAAGGSSWAPYLAAGASYRADGGARGGLYLLAALGVEGPSSHGLAPAFEVGLGGGLRVGVALRRRLTGGS